MKPGIHPTYYHSTVKCISCNSEFGVGAARQNISVEVCAKCHPFYTGKRTLVDTAGRVEKFRMKMQKKESLSSSK